MSSAVGIMAIKIDRENTCNKIRFLYGHTTDSMVLPHQIPKEMRVIEDVSNMRIVIINRPWPT
jgi:hypothetical protein